MCRFIVFALFFIIHVQTGLAATIDQRQNGDLNVQIDLKNFNIVGLTKGKEEYVDYDYVYDYSEMTIKPSSGTTKKPLNVTVSPTANKDNSTAASTELDSTTASLQNGTISMGADTTTITSTTDSSTVSNVTPSIESSSSQSSQCKRGFFRNNKGNCELKLQNPSNALLKMIMQKGKLGNNNSPGSR